MPNAKKKLKKNPIAQGLALIRWAKATKKERLAEGKRLSEARRRRRLESIPK